MSSNWTNYKQYYADCYNFIDENSNINSISGSCLLKCSLKLN